MNKTYLKTIAKIQNNIIKEYIKNGYDFQISQRWIYGKIGKINYISPDGFYAVSIPDILFGINPGIFRKSHDFNKLLPDINNCYILQDTRELIDYPEKKSQLRRYKLGDSDIYFNYEYIKLFGNADDICLLAINPFGLALVRDKQTDGILGGALPVRRPN